MKNDRFRRVENILQAKLDEERRQYTNMSKYVQKLHVERVGPLVSKTVKKEDKKLSIAASSYVLAVD